MRGAPLCLGFLLLVAGCAGVQDRASPGPGASGEAAVPSLATMYQAYFPIGAAVEPESLVTQGSLLAAQVNSLVAENAMKWERIHPLKGTDASSYNFTGADAIVAFAQEHGMQVRGHNLVWHQQVPDWVFKGESGPATKAEVLSRMRSHIDALLAHFRGTIYCWDVVNEALADGAGTWRDSLWYRTAGSDEDGEAQAHHLTGVTFWGIADDHTWLDYFPVKGRKDWPLLFDTHHRPKAPSGP